MSFRITRLTSLVVLSLASVQLAHGATATFKCPTGQKTANKACCALFPVVDMLQKDLFEGGQCGEDAHSALRIAFHDAIGWSRTSDVGGGADGSSLVFADTENEYPANLGVDDITAIQIPFLEKVRKALGLNISAGDFVHLAAAVGTANCPGAPRLKFMYGRPPPKQAAQDNTVPEPTDTVGDILARFDDAGFDKDEVVALLASHSIAAADVIDESIPGTPFDSTPGTFDSQFYLETMLVGTLLPGNGSHLGEVLSPLRGEMRLESDAAFGRDGRTACLWQRMINDQDRMMKQFKAAMAKLQVLGQNTQKLIDCSDVVPVPKAFKGPIKYPASFHKKEVEISCNDPRFPFPNLKTPPGPAPVVQPVGSNAR